MPLARRMHVKEGFEEQHGVFRTIGFSCHCNNVVLIQGFADYVAVKLMLIYSKHFVRKCFSTNEPCKG